MDSVSRQRDLACSQELQISVRFDEGSWVVDCSPMFEILSYPSGAAAEEAARRLATRFAQQGQAVHVVIEDRRHALVGTQTYFASELGQTRNSEIQA